MAEVTCLDSYMLEGDHYGYERGCSGFLAEPRRRQIRGGGPLSGRQSGIGGGTGRGECR